MPGSEQARPARCAQRAPSVDRDRRGPVGEPGRGVDVACGDGVVEGGVHVVELDAELTERVVLVRPGHPLAERVDLGGEVRGVAVTGARPPVRVEPAAP